MDVPKQIKKKQENMEKVKVDGFGLLIFIVAICTMFVMLNSYNTNVISKKVENIESVIIKNDSIIKTK